MAFVSGFQHDVFVSYAHENNEPGFVGSSTGWVDDFAADLKRLLKQYIGRPDSLGIWTDHTIRGNDDFDYRIDNAFKNAAVFLFVLSPGYVKSPHCRKEWEEFARICDGGPGFTVGGATRAFKVELFAVPDDDHPYRERKITGYRFFEAQPSGHQTRFRRTSQHDPDHRYWQTMDRLAQDLAHTLSALDGQFPSAPASDAVFLAAVSSDLRTVRDDLQSTLKQLGVGVLPESGALDPGAAAGDAIRRTLQRSFLSVHLLSAQEDQPAPEGEETLQELQLSLARNRAALAPLKTIVWLSDPLPRSQKPEHVRLIDAIRREPAPLIVSGSVEELKDRIYEQMGRPIPMPRPRERLSVRVFVACDAPDYEDARELARRLHEDWSVEVLVSSPNEDLTKFRVRLNSARGLLLLYGRGESESIERRMMTAGAVAEQRIKNPLVAMRVCSGPPPKPRPGVYLHRMPVVDCPDGYSLAYLSDFYQSLSAAAKPGV